MPSSISRMRKVTCFYGFFEGKMIKRELIDSVFGKNKGIQYSGVAHEGNNRFIGR